MLKLVITALLSVAVCRAALVGGYSDVNTDSKDVQEVISFVQSSINARSNDMYSSRVSDIVRVQRQLVNGFNYEIEFQFARTGCSKASLISLKTCPLSGRVDRCTAIVYRSFAGEQELKEFSCQPYKVQKRAGGISEPKEDPESYRDEAIRALSETNSLLDASKDFKVVEVRTQVVQGLMTYMKIRGQANGVLSDCDFTIWDRPWLTNELKYQVSAKECHPVKVQKRSLLGENGRSCAGCVQDEKPVDTDTQDLFASVVKSANGGKLSAINLKKTKFISMRTQVIAGIRYFIKLETEINGEMQKCDAVLVSTPWLEKANTITEFTCQ